MVWLLFYIIGTLILLCGILIYTKNCRDGRNAGVVFLVLLFLVVFLWYIPIEVSQNDYTIPEGILSALLQAVGALKADSFNKEFVYNNSVSSLFAISIMVVRIIILLLTFGIVISLFRMPVQYILNWIYKNKKTYVFLGVNDKTISIAQSIPNKENAKIVFIDKDLSAEKTEMIKKVGGLCFQKSVGYIFSRIIKDHKRYSDTNLIEVFVFGESEKDNLILLDEIFEKVKNDKYRKIRVFCELRKLSWNIQNDLIKKYTGCENIIVNFVRPEENFVLNNLYDNYLFKNAIGNDNEKEIKLLIIGYDNISAAFLKTALWLGQLPGYNLSIRVVSNEDVENRFRFECPSINLEEDKPGYARYRIEFFNINSFSIQDYWSAIKDYVDFTFAFVNSGDSITNINIATDLCMFRARGQIDNKFKIQVRNDNNTSFLNNDSAMWSNIQEVGRVDEIYSYASITNSVIDAAARLIHEERQKNKKPANRKRWEEYSKDEYMRQSVYARALSIHYKLYLIRQYYSAEYSLLAQDEEWIEYEHMRWNVYSFVHGYVYAEKKDIYLAKTHCDLIPYDKLSDEKKRNDSVVVNDEIVKGLLTEI